LRNYWQRLK